ncbi:MAG: hypothetical protein IJW64_05405 [Clostridia bacterium]|nr:hypothetical protein [Clostridia bacterium]
MGQKMETKMYCQTGKGAFIAVFEELKSEEWYSMEAKPLPPEKPAQKQSFFQKLGLAFSSKPTTTTYNPPKKHVKGAFFIGDMKCPFCGNKSFVKCGSCGELTCFPEGGKRFKCIPCGNEGEISGTISDMDGDVNNDRKSDSSLSRPEQRKNGPTLR